MSKTKKADKTDKTNQINQFDLAFVIDTTGSMGGFITSAKKEMLDLIGGLTKQSHVDIRIGVVEYRDHTDGEVTRVHAFKNIKGSQKDIDSLTVGGGGDECEAVFDGIVDACNKLEWRKNARRIIVLVGDAPPHGLGFGGDSFPKGCPCGQTVASVTRLAEDLCIVVHSIGLTQVALKSFGDLTFLTGGTRFDADRHSTPMKELEKLLQIEFSDLKLDQQVMDLWNDEGLDEGQIATRLDVTPFRIGQSIGRLRGRDLLKETETATA